MAFNEHERLFCCIISSITIQYSESNWVRGRKKPYLLGVQLVSLFILAEVSWLVLLSRGGLRFILVDMLKKIV